MEDAGIAEDALPALEEKVKSLASRIESLKREYGLDSAL